MDKASVGKFGENEAVRLLKAKGFNIVQTNYRSRYGEIDIIANDDNTLAFVEVRTRSVNYLVSPGNTVNFRKQSKLIKTAQMYLSEHDINLQPRMDVIEVLVKRKGNIIAVDEINHIENAFTEEREF